jgi:hypothetical protein
MKGEIEWHWLQPEHSLFQQSPGGQTADARSACSGKEMRLK